MPIMRNTYQFTTVRKILLILLGAVLFAAAFPNPLVTEGLPLLAWVAFIPVFLVARNSSLPGSALWGALYALGAYGLFNYWLTTFNPLAGLIVSGIYALYFALLFPLLTIAYRLFPRHGFVLQWLLWLAYEYLRTLGFLGYPYGISGYTQWRMIPLIQIADLAGVWGVSALVVFPSAYLAGALQDGPASCGVFLRRHRIPALCWGLALAFVLLYGSMNQVDYSTAPKKNIALIQNNSDPWIGGLETYRENFYTLRRLSDEALAGPQKPDLVVWPETAFIPRIYWHSVYRDDQQSYALVKELMDYLESTSVPFLIGNDDGRKEVNEQGEYERVDYNATLLYEGSQERGLYRKMHLVPFTENFPYKKQFPRIYAALLAADTHLWKPGDTPTVFQTAGFMFSTPICFEDSFGYISRRFVRAGAEVIVNVTNDAWAKSLSAQMQHLTMAVFRAVENRRSMVRASASGQTCAIDPNGRVTAMAPPFAQSQITVVVPVYTEKNTGYTVYGDIFGILPVIAVVVLLVIGGVSQIGLRLKPFRGSELSH